MESKEKFTIFCDIDGTLVYHHGSIRDIETNEPVILEGTKSKMDEWWKLGYYVVLTTARPESLREMTEKDLAGFDLHYDKLIMDLPNYRRVLINDTKPYMLKPGNINPNTAIGIMVKRDKGIKDLQINE